MTLRFTAWLVALSTGLAAAPAIPQAQTKTPPAKSAKPTPGKAARPAAKKAVPPPPPPPPELPLPAADDNQLAASQLIFLGEYACEFSQTVDVVLSPKATGYIDVDYKKQVFTMKPVLSTTGARRLEDVKGRMLMIQIANKSMLMDVETGHRVVDDCVHEQQRAARAAPPPSESLGIDPVKAAAAEAAASAASAAAAAAQTARVAADTAERTAAVAAAAAQAASAAAAVPPAASAVYR